MAASEVGFDHSNVSLEGSTEQVSGKGDKKKMTVKLDKKTYRNSLDANDIPLDMAKKVHAHDTSYVQHIDKSMVDDVAGMYKKDKDIHAIKIEAPFTTGNSRNKIIVGTKREAKYPGLNGAPATVTSIYSTTVQLDLAVTKDERKARQKDLHAKIVG